MMDPAGLTRDLRALLALCQQLQALAERESCALRDPEQAAASAFEFFQQRKALLPRLDQSLASLKQHRAAWQRLDPAERRRQPELGALLRASQDAIMKVLVLDRENEQARLRCGLALPAAGRPCPRYVAELYRRHSR